MLKVGSVVRAKLNTGVCSTGDIGVCYEVYELGGRPGYSVIFQSGKYDGFSPSDVEMMLTEVDFSEDVAEYEFKNVIQLHRDFERGIFDEAFLGDDYYANN